MKSKIALTLLCISLFSGICFAQSQPDGKGRKPPTSEERLKMVNEKICTPLKLDKSQTAKVSVAFKDFFTEMDKLMDFKTNPLRMPEKSKVDALAKIRDNKVKKVIPENLFDKYIELEKSIRPAHEGNPPKQ
jgi:thiamine biosynthesis lipoprotein ApbE